MARRALADELVPHGNAARAGRLRNVHGVPIDQDGDIRGLADRCSHLVADHLGLPGEVDAGRNRSSDAQCAAAQRVGAVGVTRDEAAPLERAEQTESGGAVDAELASHSAHGLRSAIGDDLEDAESAIHRLHRACFTRGISRPGGVVMHAHQSRPVVDSETPKGPCRRTTRPLTTLELSA